MAVPKYLQEGGTYVIPGHGRVGDEADLLDFRDMVVILRDRIASLSREGHDAGAGHGDEAHARLRPALRDGRVDIRDVRRGVYRDLQQRKGGR